MADQARNAAGEQPTADELLALQRAFEQFTESTATLETAYRELRARAETLDQELAEKNRELAVATDYLNSILESMSDGVIAVDGNGVITLLNGAARTILGFEPNEGIGETFEATFGRPMPPAGRLHAGELVTRDGQSIPVSERTAPLTGKRTDPAGHVMVFQDLSEIEYLRERVQRKDRLAAIGEMAATVAHEIRNPLGGVRGFAALLDRDLPAEDPRSRLVEKILEGTHNLDRVVNELLEFTRPVELRRARCNLNELVQAAEGLAGIDAERIAVTISVPEAIEIYADADRVRQVFLNMLLNANQSIEGNGRIGIVAERQGDSVAITIEDSGHGIEPAHLDKIFSPFFTTKEKGTGLGLAVAAKIVDSHGGTLSASSTPGQGTEFLMTLPLDKDTAQ